MRIVAAALGSLALLVAAPALAMSIHEVPNPRARGSWIADTNDMIDAATEARLDQAISAFEAERGAEIAVVCVESVDTPTPKDFATGLFNLWHVGKAGKDDGLLVLMVRGERRLEMETGYGLEPVLTDGWLKTMQQDEMIPFFKAGDYGAGLEAGVRASIARLRAYPDGVPAGAEPPRRAAVAPPTARGGSTGGGRWPLFLFGGFVVLAGGAWRVLAQRAERTCPRCRILMTMVPEDEDDALLGAGEQAEEDVGSIDHQLYQCATCDFGKHIRVESWLSSMRTCRSCGYKTARRSSRTIREPTYTSTGLREVTRSCLHCHHDEIDHESIPMRTRSTSSSSGFSGGSSWSGGSSSFGSSSSSSFGGGSSGGGGAGSSW
jgi:uncharacterized protein